MTALTAIKLSPIVNKLTNFGQVTLIIFLTLDKLKRLFISLYKLLASYDCAFH